MSQGWGNDDNSPFSWFGPRKQEHGIPRRRKRKTREPFEWTNDAATRILFQKRSGFDDNFITLFTGFPVPAAKPGKLLVIAESPVAREFVDHTTANLRNLGTTLVADREMTSGELRGPISWAETLSVRSTSFGLDYAHVCTIQKRTYDSPENRVVAAALHRVAQSVPDKWRTNAMAQGDPAIATALEADLLLRSRPLNRVKILPASKLTMAKKRARNTRKTGFYNLALAVLDLPLRETSTALAGEDDVLVLCDAATHAQHALVLEIEKKLLSMGLEPNEQLVVVDDALQLGNTRFKAGGDGFVELAGTRIGVTGHGSADIMISHPDDLSNAIVSTLRKRAL